MKCAIIIPIYNEQEVIADTLIRIAAVAKKIPDFEFEIICVNDGSTDKSLEVLLKHPGLTVLNHHANRGYGAALRTGLDFCTSDWVFIVDADGTYPLEDLPRLVAEIKPGIQMVVGARHGSGISNYPWRKLARWILKKLVHSLTGVMVPDLNSGMRLFRRTIYLKFSHLLPMGFSFTSTITVASLYSNYGIRYIPIEYSHRVGKSNIKPVRDFIGFSILIVRLASYFEPLSFFLPASFIAIAIGTLRGIRDILVTNGIGSLAVILIFFGFQLFVIGVLTDVVVRRAMSDQKLPLDVEIKNDRFTVIKTPVSTQATVLD